MLGRLIKSLDPRLSLAARIAWGFGIISIILSMLAGLHVANLSQAAVEREIGALYVSRAQHIADAIDLEIQSGFDTMQLTASVLQTTGQMRGGVGTEKLIEAIRKHLSDAAWIGVTDPSGAVLAGDFGRLEGTSLATQDWFTAAEQGSYVHGPEQFPELAKLLAPKERGQPRNFLLISAPIVNDVKALSGYTVTCFDMDWIDEIQRRAGESLAGMRPIDIFILNDDGMPVNQILDGIEPPEKDLSDRIRTAATAIPQSPDQGFFTTDNYLIGFAKTRGLKDFKGARWTVIIREAKYSAYLPANNTAVAIALSCLVLGLGLTVAATLGTKYILRGLTRIAASADALRTGVANEFVALTGNDEVARISLSLSSLFNSQKQTNEQLADLNRTLDRKVIERTREVQRLSEETSSAAITRERLRMSRDLHDTLAQSMLAMLTQIRLIQKLYKSRPELIKEELGHAEKAAQDGLNLAREAVTELRYFAVRDDGLEQAIRKLVKGLKERVEIEVTLEIDDAASKLAGPKMETVYRIVEEALRNVEKHAKADHVIVGIELDQTDPGNHLLKVSVEDNGRGFDQTAPAPGHFGLPGMKEQTDILGGKLGIASASAKGTRIQLEVSI
jgi:signal transduction histidine kinase